MMRMIVCVASVVLMLVIANAASTTATLTLKPARTTVSQMIKSMPATHSSRFQSVLTSQASAPVRHQKLHPYTASSVPKRTLVQSSVTLPVVYPTDFGADPTGNTDSSPAFTAAMSYILSLPHPHPLSDGMVDLDGLTLDLAGGEYLVSQPIIVPPMYGNFRIQRGTLRAMKGFPAKQFIIQVGNSSAPKVSQGCANENIGLSELMIDGQQYASGGIVIWHTMGAVLGPQNFYLGFTSSGVTVEGGHEVQILNSWFGQYLYSDPRKETGTATGINIFGNDHVVSNVVVFSAQTGIYVTGAANLIYNAHTWNCATGNGGVGIIIAAPQNRIVASYLDFTNLHVIDPEHVLVTDCFFLGGGSIVIQSGSNHQIQGLVIRDNEFDVSCCSGNSFGISVDESKGQFTALIDTVIEGNAYSNGWIGPGTRIRDSLELSLVPNTTDSYACFDLTAALLFPQFALTQIQATVQYFTASNILPDNSIHWYVTTGRNSNVPAKDLRTVCIYANLMPKTTGIVYIDVDQSTSSQKWQQNRRL